MLDLGGAGEGVEEGGAEAAEAEEGLVAGGEEGGPEDAGEVEVVGGVVEDAEKVEDVEDLLLLVEAAAGDDVVGDGLVFEGFLVEVKV